MFDLMTSKRCSASAISKDGIPLCIRKSLQPDEVCFFAVFSRTFGFLSMYLVEHGFHALLKSLVLRALVELANKVTPDLECIEGEIQSRTAEILYSC